MTWIVVIGWAAVVIGVAGYVLGLRGSRRTDAAERGLFWWMAATWLGVALLVSAEVG